VDSHLGRSIYEAAAEQARLEEDVARQRDQRAALEATVDSLTARATTGESVRSPIVSRRQPRISLSRRRMLQWGGLGLAGSTVIAGTPGRRSGSEGSRTSRSISSELLGISWPESPRLEATSKTPTIFVPLPTGVASIDTFNILQALQTAKGGTAVVLQWSPSAVYAVDQELPIFPGIRLTGQGPTMEAAPGGLPTLRQVAGVPLQCIAASASYYGPSSLGKYSQFNSLYNNGIQRSVVDGAIEVDHVAFDGQNGGTGSGNTSGHGMVLLSFSAKLHDCYFLNIANTAMVLADANYLGVLASNENHENRIQDNTVVNPGWYGLYVGSAPGGATDGYILDNKIASPSQQQRTAGPLVNPASGKYYEGIHMANSAGWWLINNHLVACPGDGASFNTTGGLHLLHNTIDGFGCNPLKRGTYSGFNITTAGQTKLHHGFVVGNLATAYEAASPFTQAAPPGPTNTYLYFRLVMQIDPGRKPQTTYQAFVNQSDNAAHQGSQPPAPILDVTLPTANALSILVPHGAASGALPGMIVTDTLGLIRPGTTVVNVTQGTGSNPDTILLSAKVARGMGDTIRFTGPASFAWSYENALSGADMLVHRTNETATGTINAVPRIVITPTAGQVSPTVHLVDPTDFAGGVYIDPAGAPVAGNIIVATSSTTAAWGPA
jgi:hypothetical protein